MALQACSVILIVLLGAESALAAEAPKLTDYKSLYYQAEQMRGQVVQEVGRLTTENAVLRQQLDTLKAELEKAKNEKPPESKENKQ